MNTNIRFFAPGTPKGQPRPRAFNRGGMTRVYDPGTAEGWKSEVAIAARPHLPSVPLDGPIRLVLTFLLPRPASHYGTGKKRQEVKLSAPQWHIGKPDADNFAKAVMDCLTSIGIWRDDSLVCELEVKKLYAYGESGKDHSKSGCWVTIINL